MPKNIISLSDEEKEKIIEKHRKIVDEFNQYLPKNNQIKYDKNLIKRLNDPKEVKYYLTLKEISEKRKFQEKTLLALQKKFGPAPKNIMPRSFLTGFKTDNTKESNEYNEKLYKIYQENPEKIFYQRYKKVLEFDPSILLEMNNDKQKLADFYLNNQKLCEDAFVFASTFSTAGNGLNPDLKAIATPLSPMIETISYPLVFSQWNMGDEYFTFPSYMTKNQALAIMGENPSYLAKNHPYKTHFYPLIDENAAKLDPLSGLKELKNQGYEFGKDFFLKYQALELNPTTLKYKEISLENALKKINDDNVVVKERKEEEIESLKKINKTYDKEYLNVFKKRFSKNFDKEPFSLEKLEYKHRGGFFERLFRRTSTEYKEFIRAFKEYNDPNSRNYLNADNLKEKAVYYFDFKTENGISFNKIGETGRNRLKFVSSVIETLDEMKNNKDSVIKEIDLNLKEDSFVKKQAVSENEVNDDLFKNESMENNNEIQINKDLTV